MKRSRIFFLIVVLILVAAGTFFWVTRDMRASALPALDGEAKLPGLTGEVTVIRDDHGIPHITAATEEDLYRATGYVMAQDRLWQMDLLRRVTAGRLSEIIGKPMVKPDVLFRSLRIREKAGEIVKEMDPEMRGNLEAFRDGVNIYLRSLDKLPFEFRLLGYEMEPWTLIDSVSLIGYMSWDLSTAWSTEIVMNLIREKVGDEMFRRLEPDFLKDTTVFPDYGVDLRELHRIFARQREVRENLGLVVLQGSNNWAVSGKKTADGKPILANDMHLGLFVPGIWYQIHQYVPGKLNVTGVALPGQPMVICGHNEDIAWGMTNVMLDDIDFYVEKIHPEDPDRYLFRGQWREFTKRQEVIKIRGKDPVKKTIRFTHRGPVISGMKDTGDKTVSMRWIGNEKSNELLTVYRLNRARNWKEFLEALETFVAIGQNVVYADVEGNIGLVNTGGVPLRPEGDDGSRLYPGWTGEHEWKGLVPFSEKPKRFNPPEGFVASANNRTVDERFPHVITRWGFAVSYRIERINELLNSHEKITVETMKKFHNDTFTHLLGEMEPAIRVLNENRDQLSGRENKALDILMAWDGRMDIESGAAAVLDSFYLSLARGIFYDEMGKDLFNRFFSSKMISQQAFRQILKDPDNPWYDFNETKKKEGFREVVLSAFRDAVGVLRVEMGRNPAKWRWGDVHSITLKHPLGRMWVVDAIFKLNSGPYPVPGSFHTIPQFMYRQAKPFEVVHGPSQRHIYTPGEWDRSLSMIPTGTSGIPGSPYYCDQAPGFMKGEYHDDPFSSEAVEKAARYRLTLWPMKQR